MDGAQAWVRQGGSPEKTQASCRIFVIVLAKPDLLPGPTGPRDSREPGGHLIFLLPQPDEWLNPEDTWFSSCLRISLRIKALRFPGFLVPALIICTAGSTPVSSLNLWLLL